MGNPGNLRVRATISEASVDHLETIIRYFAERWAGLKNLHLEPVYVRRRAGSSFQPRRFVTAFLRARALARSCGIDLMYAGTRPGERHRQFCPVLQNNLVITPEGFLSACFCVTGKNCDDDSRFLYGSYEGKEKRIQIEYQKLQSFFLSLRQEAGKCQKCLNRFHCSRGCPEVCPLEPNYLQSLSQFDCEIQKNIGYALQTEKGHLPFRDVEDPTFLALPEGL
jgi:uncharacterized protein